MQRDGAYYILSRKGNQIVYPCRLFAAKPSSLIWRPPTETNTCTLAGLNDQEDMSEGYRHDPVSAIAEAEATGETAVIFADIRQTMQLPLITSIWRTLAGVEGGLRAVWAVAKPLYESGQPDAALFRVFERAVLPVPEPLVPDQLDCPRTIRSLLRHRRGRPCLRCLRRPTWQRIHGPSSTI